MSTNATPPTPAQEIENAWDAYQTFDDGQKLTDANNLQANIDAWKNMSGSAEMRLMLFWVMVMAGGSGGLDGGSFVRGQEDLLTEVAKKMNYASGYRDVVAEIKNQLVQATQDNPGNTDLITADIHMMNKYLTSSDPNAPTIFQNAGDTFTSAENDINSILAEVGPGKTYSSLYNLQQQAQTVSPGQTNQASTDFQKFVNACDTLSSAVGVQSNVLSTMLQDTESNYNSYLSSDSQAVKSLFSITDFALQHMIST